MLLGKMGIMFISAGSRHELKVQEESETFKFQPHTHTHTHQPCTYSLIYTPDITCKHKVQAYTNIFKRIKTRIRS